MAAAVSHTFKDVEQKTLNHSYRSKLSEVVTYDPNFDKELDKVVVSTDKGNTISPHLGNGLMDAIYRAYSQHIPLVIRPDDVWLSICVAFGKYVVTHSEEVKHLFVQHEGRKELEVKAAVTLAQLDTPEKWSWFTAAIVEEIRKNSDEKMCDWFLPKFSTTTELDEMVSQLVLMGATKEYFDFKCTLCCGLSKVTLEGTLEDWQNIVERAKSMYTFKNSTITAWTDLLVPVLEQFVEFYKGSIDEEFWQRVCTYISRGSGGEKGYRGWFLVFSPFDADGKYMLRPKEKVDEDHIYGMVDDADIISGTITVPIRVDDNGVPHEMVVSAGVAQAEYDLAKNELRASVGWTLYEKKIVEYNDLVNSLDKFYQKGMKSWYKPTQQTIDAAYKLLDFAYYAATEFLFPNDSLMCLPKLVTTYSRRYHKDNATVTKDNYHKFIGYVQSKDSIYDGVNRDLGKYVDSSRINDVIDAYCNNTVKIDT